MVIGEEQRFVRRTSRMAAIAVLYGGEEGKAEGGKGDEGGVVQLWRGKMRNRDGSGGEE